jgi:hypothetical protein
MRKTMVGVAAAAAMLAPVAAVVPTTTGSVKVSRMVDCEDQDVQPCITLDDGRWRLVYSYSPYTSTVIRKCGRDVGPPCFRHRMDTYEYVWRWTL